MRPIILFLALILAAPAAAIPTELHVDYTCDESEPNVRMEIEEVTHGGFLLTDTEDFAQPACTEGDPLVHTTVRDSKARHTYAFFETHCDAGFMTCTSPVLAREGAYGSLQVAYDGLVSGSDFILLSDFYGNQLSFALDCQEANPPAAAQASLPPVEERPHWLIQAVKAYLGTQ